MNFRYKKVGDGLNKCGVLYVYNSVTEILTATNSNENIRYLIVSIKIAKNWFIFLVSEYFKHLTDKSIMFAQINKDSKGMKDLVALINNGEKVAPTLDPGEMVIDDPPTAEHRETSLMENAVTLGNRSERLITSNLLLFGGIPANYSHSQLITTMLFLAKMIDQLHKIGINIPELEAYLSTCSREQIILYSDNITCSFTISLPHDKLFSMGGHNPFPPAQQ